MDFSDFLSITSRLEEYIKKLNYEGYDPYDALNSDLLARSNLKYFNLILTQALVYSPINIRRFLKIKKGKNPKGIGLIISAYSYLYQANLLTLEEFKEKISSLLEYLEENHSKDYRNLCWGYNFPWQDITRFSARYTPTIVITSYIQGTFLDIYEITRDEELLTMAKSCSRFVLEDLNRTENEYGLCFSYTPIDKNVVFNANILGGSLLARMYSLTGDRLYKDYAEKCADFVIRHQHDDGSWAYIDNFKNGKERNQIDFHQGTILCALCDYIDFLKPADEKYLLPLMKGADFYQTQQFAPDGQSKWRYPSKYPVDIHHQAQGIITFCRLYDVTKKRDYLNFAKEIAEWTIRNMWDDDGYFYYQKWPFILNRISYMRWGQAWMFYALAYLLKTLKNEKP